MLVRTCMCVRACLCVCVYISFFWIDNVFSVYSKKWQKPKVLCVKASLRFGVKPLRVRNFLIETNYKIYNNSDNLYGRIHTRTEKPTHTNTMIFKCLNCHFSLTNHPLVFWYDFWWILFPFVSLPISFVND